MISNFNFPEYNILNIQEDDESYYIEAEVTQPPQSCRYCGTQTKLYRHTKNRQFLVDVPIKGKRVVIMINRRRYKCRECERTFYEALPHKDEKRECTKRLIDYIRKQSLTQTFVNLAHEIGVNEKTIRNICKDAIKKPD